jgi:hypothetical protein
MTVSPRDGRKRSCYASPYLNGETFHLKTIFSAKDSEKFFFNPLFYVQTLFFNHLLLYSAFLSAMKVSFAFKKIQTFLVHSEPSLEGEVLSLQ